MDQRLAQLIGKAERDAVMAPIDVAMTLPVNAYADDTWFELELERIFERRWTGVFYECELPAAGDARPFDFFGKPLLAVRADDGQLRVFHNICPYDGWLAVRCEAKGLTEIEVYYHGWRYGLDGRLLIAPYWNGEPQCGPEGLGWHSGNLVEVRSEVRIGVLFVNLDGLAQDIDSWLAPWRARIGEEFAVDALVPARDCNGHPAIETRFVDANWKTYQENASINILHESFTHELYRKSPEVPRIDAKGEPTFETWTDDCLLAFGYARSNTGKTYDPIHLTTLYPNLNIPLLECIIKVNIALPVSAGRTYLQHLRFYRPEALEAENFKIQEQALQKLFDAVHYEDQLAIEAVQRGRASPVWRQHYYAPFWDTLHHRFNQLVMLDMEKT